MLPRSYRK